MTLEWRIRRVDHQLVLFAGLIADNGPLVCDAGGSGRRSRFELEVVDSILGSDALRRTTTILLSSGELVRAQSAELRYGQSQHFYSLFTILICQMRGTE